MIHFVTQLKMSLISKAIWPRACLKPSPKVLLNTIKYHVFLLQQALEVISKKKTPGVSMEINK